jgi:tRNA G18 (ribose-2'-O)-methylase SpoU
MSGFPHDRQGTVLQTECGKSKEVIFKKNRVLAGVNNLKTASRRVLPRDLSGRYLYLCGMRKLRMDELPRISRDEFRRAEKFPVILVLENIRSMHNVGSVFRTADAFLAQSIYLCGYTPRPPHRDIHKTALGATDTVEWKYLDSAVSAVRELRDAGYRIVAVEQVEGSVPLQYFTRRTDEKLAVIFGNEVDGVSEQVLALCETCIEIPQFGMKHSLNVSVAAGMVLWELVRKECINI